MKVKVTIKVGFISVSFEASIDEVVKVLEAILEAMPEGLWRL